jgi:hypothetical protein
MSEAVVFETDTTAFETFNQKLLAQCPEMRRVAGRNLGVEAERAIHVEIPNSMEAKAHMEDGVFSEVAPDGSDVTFGVQGCPYALAVHERLQSPSGNSIHYTKPGSKAKFVEDPAKQIARERMGELMTRAAEEVLGR